MIESSRLKQLMVFVILAISSYAVYEKYFSSNDQKLFQPFTKGYAISGVTIESTDENGQIVTTIKSPSVIHYADTGKTVIEQPDITLHESDGDWSFQSTVGEINPEQTQIYFPNEVIVNLINDVMEGDVNALAMNTSALTVDMAYKKGSTSEKIQMNQTGSMINGIGAEIDFNQQQIEILSEMYAEFEN